MSSDSSSLSNPTGGHCVGPQSSQAGKADSCKGCPNASICASNTNSEPDKDIPIITDRLSKIKHKVLILSGKGGVGKSTLTKELGFALGRDPYNMLVGLVDIDICGPSLPRLTGTRSEEIHASADGWEPISVDNNVSLISMHFLMSNKNDAVIWRGPKKNGMIKNFLKEVAWEELDLLLFDTPPGTGDEHISTVNFLKECGGLTGAIIITTPQEVALADVRREINFCHKVNIPIIGIVENMSGFTCPSCMKRSDVFPSLYKEGTGERLVREYGVTLLGKIPLDPVLMMSCENGVSLGEEVTNTNTNTSIDNNNNSGDDDQNNNNNNNKTGDRSGGEERGRECSPTVAAISNIVKVVLERIRVLEEDSNNNNKKC